MKGLKRDWKTLKRVLSSNREFSDFEALWRGSEIIPTQCDILIIGGGAIGSSIAYWLREKIHRDDFSVVVIEKDPTVRHRYTCAFLVLKLSFSIGSVIYAFDQYNN